MEYKIQTEKITTLDISDAMQLHHARGEVALAFVASPNFMKELEADEMFNSFYCPKLKDVNDTAQIFGLSILEGISSQTESIAYVLGARCAVEFLAKYGNICSQETSEELDRLAKEQPNEIVRITR